MLYLFLLLTGHAAVSKRLKAATWSELVDAIENSTGEPIHLDSAFSMHGFTGVALDVSRKHVTIFAHGAVFNASVRTSYPPVSTQYWGLFKVLSYIIYYIHL